MKNFIFGILTVLIIGAVVFFAYRAGEKNMIKFDDPALSPTLTVTDNPVLSPTKQMVGSDKDEHGCIGSAGYSWCESKNKCLRIFEEGCPTKDDNELIKTALFDKNGWKETDGITVTVSTNDGKYASGGATAQGGGGYFFAVKDNNEWVIVADGNGVIPCSSLEKYPDYPKTLIPECWDEERQENIKR